MRPPKSPHRRDSRPEQRRRPAPSTAPLLPLRQIIAGVEKTLCQADGKPPRQALRDAWRQEDSKQGERPDYLLWRHTQCRECPPDKRRDPVELAVRTLRANTPMIQWVGVILSVPLLLSDTTKPDAAAALADALSQRLAALRAPLTGSERSCAVARWMASVAVDIGSSKLTVGSALAHLNDLVTALGTAVPDWKPLRDLDADFVTEEGLFTESTAQVLRRWVDLLRRICASVQADAPVHPEHWQDLAKWRFTAWRWLVSAGKTEAHPTKRDGPRLPRRDELLALLDAAQTQRVAGDGFEAARLTALALSLVPEQRREAEADRFSKAAWSVAEAGLELPKYLRVNLAELPFPGDPPQSALGLEASRIFADDADVSRQLLLRQVATDERWQQLRDAGVALHHPLAALAWVAKKAQSFALKKSAAVIETAARLALENGCIGSAGKLMQEQPNTELVISYAKAMRESLRRMPILREGSAWQQWATSLRLAWGKLEADSISDEETLFMLHETLLDRPTTALRSLPNELRILALRHPHSRRSPSPLILSLAAEPSQMRSLEHQRALEHWSLASDARTKPELARTAWVSLVTRGDPTTGKYSLLAIGPAGQIARRGRIVLPNASDTKARDEALAKVIAEATAEVSPEAEWLLLATSHDLVAAPWLALLRAQQLQAIASLVPSWEWASRVLRDTRSDSANLTAEVLAVTSLDTETLLTSAETLAAQLPQACVLLTDTSSSAATKWTHARKPLQPASEETVTPEHRPILRRSTHIGQHALVVAHSPCTDLVSTCLAHGTRLFIEASEPLSELAATRLHQAASKGESALRLALLSDAALSHVVLHGVLSFATAPKV